MSKIKNGGLDQYGAEPFEQQQFGTAGVEGVKHSDGGTPVRGFYSCYRSMAVTSSAVGLCCSCGWDDSL